MAWLWYTLPTLALSTDRFEQCGGAFFHGAHHVLEHRTVRKRPFCTDGQGVPIWAQSPEDQDFCCPAAANWCAGCARVSAARAFDFHLNCCIFVIIVPFV